MDIFEAVEAIKNGKTVKSNRNCIYKRIDNSIYLKNSEGKFIPSHISSDEIEFEIVIEEVNFEEALEAYKNGKDIKCCYDNHYSIFYNNYNKCNTYNFIKGDDGEGISLEEMLHGKWYVL